MAMIKLSDYAAKIGVSYLTCWRWYKAGTLPAATIRTESGTILVDENSTIKSTDQNQAISLLLKKTVELSKNNGSLEDLSAYVVSNFNLQIASEEKKIELQNLVKNEGSEGTLKCSENEGGAVMIPSVWLSDPISNYTSTFTNYSLNAAYSPETSGISAGNFTFDGSLGNYEDPNLSLYGQSSVFVANVVPEMSVICGSESEIQMDEPIPEDPPKPRGRGRPKKITSEGEEK